MYDLGDFVLIQYSKPRNVHIIFSSDVDYYSMSG